MQDPIADFLTRVRNAQTAAHPSVTMPHSKAKVAICRVFEQEGYIGGFSVSEGAKRELRVDLKYREGRPIIEKLRRVSRPGLRIYRSHEDLPRVRGGLGVAVISTSRGVMTDGAARALGIGGEVLCTVF